VILDFDPSQGAVPVAEAARIARVTPRMIHMWVTRGYLDREGQRQKVPEYHIGGVRQVVPVDVAIAKAATARQARGRPRKNTAA
jgi:hypothetical protein